MRFKPVGPIIMRRSLKQDTIGARTIPKGSNIIINLVAMHNSKDFFAAPQQFDPNNISQQQKKEFVPFGAGPKGCAGQHLAMVEMKVILTTLVRDFKFSIDRKLETIATHWDIAEQPMTRIEMHLNKRRKHIFLCGAHSTGKTTLTNALHEKWPYFTVIQEVGRKLLKELGWNAKDLDEPQNRKLFQSRILEAQCKCEREVEHCEYVVSDRGIDLLTYVKYYLPSEVAFYQQLVATPEAQECLERYRNGLVFVLKPQHSLMVDDGVRMIPDWNQLVGFTQSLCEILRQYKIPFILIDMLPLEERVQVVLKALSST